MITHYMQHNTISSPFIPLNFLKINKFFLGICIKYLYFFLFHLMIDSKSISAISFCYNSPNVVPSFGIKAAPILQVNVCSSNSSIGSSLKYCCKFSILRTANSSEVIPSINIRNSSPPILPTISFSLKELFKR